MWNGISKTNLAKNEELLVKQSKIPHSILTTSQLTPLTITSYKCYLYLSKQTCNYSEGKIILNFKL